MNHDVKKLNIEINDLKKKVERYEKVLKTISEWDCLNPPDPQLLSDLPWLKSLVDEALFDDT